MTIHFSVVAPGPEVDLWQSDSSPSARASQLVFPGVSPPQDVERTKISTMADRRTPGRARFPPPPLPFRFILKKCHSARWSLGQSGRGEQRKTSCQWLSEWVSDWVIEGEREREQVNESVRDGGRERGIKMGRVRRMRMDENWGREIWFK